ncbi:hypothetical protein EDD11_007573 [Mortierella claussenii]|nr:hypothetical protein EDD11_007573 [Mortierella claussenii]
MTGLSAEDMLKPETRVEGLGTEADHSINTTPEVSATLTAGQAPTTPLSPLTPKSLNRAPPPPPPPPRNNGALSPRPAPGIPGRAAPPQPITIAGGLVNKTRPPPGVPGSPPLLPGSALRPHSPLDIRPMSPRIAAPKLGKL